MIGTSRITADAPVVDLPNQAQFIRAAFEGAPIAPLIQTQLNILHAAVVDPSAYMMLGLLYQLFGQKENALACQEAALLHASVYRQAPLGGQAATLRLLVFVTQGDLMTNTPIELLLEGRPVEIIRLYVDRDLPLPDQVPDHDVALVGVSESDEGRPILERLKGIGATWPRPVLNDPAAILDLARDRAHLKLEGIPGLLIPPTVRAPRPTVEQIALGATAAEDVLSGEGFPLIVRPVGSHAGQGLLKIDDEKALYTYLKTEAAGTFYLSPYVDYASADGRFRKYRVAVFGGRPYLAHMAIGDHWMVHYLNAGMASSATKRAEEAQAMAGFDAGFAARHSAALAQMSARLGLDYYAVDCAETPQGDLLIFEADVGMIIHNLDPEALYPYKPAQMKTLFAAFEAMLQACVVAA